MLSLHNYLRSVFHPFELRGWATPLGPCGPSHFSFYPYVLKLKVKFFGNRLQIHFESQLAIHKAKLPSRELRYNSSEKENNYERKKYTFFFQREKNYTKKQQYGLSTKVSREQSENAGLQVFVVHVIAICVLRIAIIYTNIGF
jgi:hypothetical protein